MLGLMGYFFASSNKGVAVLMEASHVYMEDVAEEYDVALDLDERISIDLEKQMISVSASSIRFNDTIVNGTVTFPITELTYIQGNFYKINEEGNLEKVNVTGIIKESLFLTKFSVGLGIMMVLIIASVIGLIVFKKMELYKKYKRVSVLITSTLVTVVFMMLSAITTQIFLIFGTFTICWLLYYIEWMIHRKRNGLTLSEQTPERVVVVNG